MTTYRFNYTPPEAPVVVPVTATVDFHLDEFGMDQNTRFSMSGGTGEYEASADDGATWVPAQQYPNDTFMAVYGTLYCKVRDKNDITNVCNAEPYPITVG